MSHELRPPMNGVLGMTELLLETPLNRNQHQFTTIIQDSSGALLSIINDILDFAKIEAGKLELEIIPFNLRELLEDIAQLLSSRCRSNNIELAVLIPPETQLHLKGDASRLRQVLINVMGNAIKFTEQGEVVVKVKSRKTTSGVALDVAISDIGISPENMERLFKPFAQADGTSTRQYGGTGLGLAISTELVSLMGGTLGVDSTPGSGSEFFFTLPLEIAESSPGRTGSWGESILEGLKVLAIDDNATNREILHHQTTSWNMTCETAGSGPAGLEIFQAALERGAPPDAVLLDMNMPGMNGIEVAQKIRAEMKKIPIIMLTSVGAYGEVRRSREIGINLYLTKPVRQQDLHSALSDAIRGVEPDLLEPANRPGYRPGKGAAPRECNLRILVAEDNTTNQLVITNMLKYMGCGVELVANGAEAVRSYQDNPCDLILMDCQMPVMDGYRATREIRALETGNARIPIIALTANALKGDREKCLNAGMDEHLSKPLKIEALTEVLSRWVPGKPQVDPPDVEASLKYDPVVFGKPANDSADMGAPSEKDPGVPGKPPVDSKDVEAPLKKDPGVPGEHSGADSGSIDPNVIKALRELQIDGEPDIVDHVVTAFLKDAEVLIAELGEALPGGDPEAVKQKTHALKSCSGNVGAMELSNRAGILEKSCETNEMDTNSALLENMRAEYVKVKTALAKELQK